jgi:hypothetical protein
MSTWDERVVTVRRSFAKGCQKDATRPRAELVEARRGACRSAPVSSNSLLRSGRRTASPLTRAAASTSTTGRPSRGLDGDDAVRRAAIGASARGCGSRPRALATSNHMRICRRQSTRVTERRHSPLTLTMASLRALPFT